MRAFARLFVVRFRADERRISLFWECGPFRWRARSAPRDRAAHIVYSQEVLGTTQKIPGALSLWVGRKRYPIACEPKQNARELRWLAAELSRYLKVPIRDC